jgi:uncharacterized protein YdaU (DUF1376 family)
LEHKHEIQLYPLPQEGVHVKMGLEPLGYYKWHVKDYRASRKVQRMGYIAKGFYRELIDEAWLLGSLPIDMAALAEICGCPVKIMEKAWPEIAPCFEESNERLYNLKLEEQRTEKDAERVKRSNSGRKGAFAKQVLASASKCHTEPSNCHIEEKRREEKRNTNTSRDKREERKPDSRHAPFKQATRDYWASKNPSTEMPWDGSEAKALSRLLQASPNLDLPAFTQMLRHRYRSDLNHAARPREWLDRVTNYAAGPLNEFKNPKEARNGKHFATKADITLEAARELLDEIRGQPGGSEDQGADVPGDGETSRCLEGNPETLRF